MLKLPPELTEVDWPDFVLEDIDVQIRLARDDAERTLWIEVRNALVQLGTVQGSLPADESAGALDAAVHRLEIGLRRLRNPLAAIRATAQLAQRRLRGNDQAVSMMQDLADSRARPLLDAHQQKLVPDDQTGGETWLVDRDQVAEALAELISNASHHSPESSQIIVRGTQCPPANGTGPLLQIQVIDSGTGMDAITLSKAFDLSAPSASRSGFRHCRGVAIALPRTKARRHCVGRA